MSLGGHAAALRRGGFFHVLNFHLLRPGTDGELEARLAGYLRRFDSATPDHVERWFATGRWPLRRPGFAPVFYDGHREHAEVAGPLCEALGITAWFMPPTALLDCPPAEQAAFCARHDLYVPDVLPPDGRLFVTRDELARLARRHVVGAHTAHHAPAADIRTDDDVERELAGPARVIAEVTGRSPTVLAWFRGTPDDAGHLSGSAARATGHRLLISATRVQRIAPDRPRGGAKIQT